MGRKRKDDSLGLPPRTYVRSGSFYYVHPDGKWENLGRDLTAAKKRAEHYNDPTGTYGTTSWFLDQFLIHFEQLAASGERSARTLEDYRTDVVPLKAYFGAMLPTEIAAHHVTEYLDLGLKAGRGVRANRERACLSSCLGWMQRTNLGGMAGHTNPCLRSAGVRRNPESERERYVTHDEYRAVFEAANKPVRLLMELTYRTLQRPESDILTWLPSIVVTKGSEKVLRFVQGKTGRSVDIALAGALRTLVEDAIGTVPVLRRPILHTREGEAYTYDGISAMLKQAQAKARRVLPELEPFGFRDLKGKGATDMWLAGEPIERIQLLCGHKTKTTTEKYIKARWRETAAPNLLQVG